MGDDITLIGEKSRAGGYYISMPNTNVEEGTAETFASASQKITESFERLEADWQRINSEFKEELLRDLSALFAEGDTEELGSIVGDSGDAT